MTELTTASFPILREIACDALVVGGGTTGLAAAAASSRGKARTLLVDANPFFGGVACSMPSWMGFHNRAFAPVVAGWPLAFYERLHRDGIASPLYPDPIAGSIGFVDPHRLKIAAATAVKEAGVEPLLHTRCVGVVKEGRRIMAVDLWSGKGLLRVRPRAVIDATDTGVVARMAGEELSRGRPGDGKVQVASWVFEVGHIDFDLLGDYFRKHPGELRPFPLNDAAGHVRDALSREGFVGGAFRKLIAHAEADGMVLPRGLMPGSFLPARRGFVTVASRVENVDPEDGHNHTRAEMEGMSQVEIWLRFLRRYVPGFADCVLSGTFNAIGIRETNHLAGEYVLRAEDLLAGRMFADAIAFGAFHLDVHTPDHKGLETRTPPTYSIPFGTLLPKETDNLLVTGRAISAEHGAQASVRVIPVLMALGEAAGVACAMTTDGRSFRDLDRQSLRKELSRHGALCFEESTAAFPRACRLY